MKINTEKRPTLYRKPMQPSNFDGILYQLRHWILSHGFHPKIRFKRNLKKRPKSDVRQKSNFEPYIVMPLWHDYGAKFKIFDKNSFFGLNLRWIFRWNPCEKFSCKVGIKWHRSCMLNRLFAWRRHAAKQNTLPDHSGIKLYVNIQVDWSGGPLNRLYYAIGLLAWFSVQKGT